MPIYCFKPKKTYIIPINNAQLNYLACIIFPTIGLQLDSAFLFLKA